MVQPKVSRGLRSLPANKGAPNGTVDPESPGEEMNRLHSDASQIDIWWSDAQRWQHTVRPYTGQCNS